MQSATLPSVVSICSTPRTIAVLVMSSSLKPLTQAVDWPRVRAFLFPEHLLATEIVRDDDLDNRWNWDPESEEPKAEAAPTADPQWLSQCYSCISPDGKLIIIGRNVRVVSLYDRHGLLDIMGAKTLDVNESEESVTCVNCVPLASQQKTNEGGIDWIAVLIGFSSGKLRVYTDTGCLLLVQKVHNEPMIGISCSSFYSPSFCGKRFNPDQVDQPDEIALAFQTTVCLVEGYVFYQTARSARSHMAKLSVSQNISDYVTDMGVKLPVTKWSFISDPSNQISLIASAGLSMSSMFDHLVSRTFSQLEPDRSRSKLQKVSTLLVTVGDSPFVGFYQTVASDSPSLLNGVAQAVVSKAKNFLPIFGSRREEASEAPVVRLEEEVGLYDPHRKGQSIVFSPDKQRMAVSDNLARVTLFDVGDRIVIRMWKGCRDAQCAFIQVPEKSASHRTSLCLAIYARRCGFIEIWRCDRGPRIACLQVDKNCSLFHVSHHLFGLSRTQWQQAAPAFDTAYVLNQEDGSLFAVQVPFSSTLTQAGSAKSRDSHLLGDLALCSDEESMADIVKQLKTSGAQKEALFSSLTSTERAAAIASILQQEMHDAVSAAVGDQVVDYEKKQILQSCARVLQLCKLHSELSAPRTLELHADLQQMPEDIDHLAQNMGWQAADVAKCLSMFSLRHSVIRPEVVPETRVQPSFEELTSCFELESSLLQKSADDQIESQSVQIRVNWKQMKSDRRRIQCLASFLFQDIVDGGNEPHHLFSLLDHSCIVPKDLLRLLFVYWLSNRNMCLHWKNWVQFCLFARTLSSQTSEAWSEGTLPITWKSICGLVVSSNNLPAVLVAMYVAKAVTDEHFSCQKKPTLQEEENLEVDEDWEQLHVDIEKLNIAVKQLEDVFLLDLLLHTDPKLKHQSLSLEELVKSSPGIVSELVSRWLVSGEHDATAVLMATRTDDCGHEAPEVGQESVASAAEAWSLSTPAFDQTKADILQHVQRCFPHSLEADVILANVSWEYAARWHKVPSVDSADLNSCISSLYNLKNQSLRHSVSCLLWKTFIVKNIEALTVLCEKMGKIPKDRICRKDIGLTEDCIEPMISFTAKMLEVMEETVHVARKQEVPLFEVDDWWRGTSRSHAVPLVLAAASVQPCNPSILLNHLHLVQVLLFMAHFQMKNVKPLSLFMPSVRHVFFRDLHASGFLTPLTDFEMNEFRRCFLIKVIVAIARTTPCPSPEAQDLLVSPARAYAKSSEWFSKVLTLSREWELSTDGLRRRFVCELYASACDPLADEVRNSCSDKGLLSLDLMSIACRRTNQIVHLEKSSVDPHALQWMQASDCEQVVATASRGATLSLLEFMLTHLPEGSQALSVATSLVTTIRVASK